MNKLNSIIAIALLAVTFTACKKDGEEPVIVAPPSDGSTLTLNGLISTEAGSSAGNSVYVDFSTDKQTSVDRDSWDLGFYSGSDFKVILNSTNGASALLINKTDLNTVTATDFDPNALKVGQGGGNFTIIDDGRETNILNKTAIATVSATDADNKVYIINRKGGSNTVLANDELYKIRVLRKGTGYTLQYAKLTATTFTSLDIVKNAESNFQFTSLVRGTTATAEPTKATWDIVWGYSMYWTAAGTTQLPYGFSDLVFINNIGGVTAAQVSTTTKTYAAFAAADVTGITFSSSRDIIGSNWRNTTGAAIGVRTDVFYVVKDGAGNVYKLKFNSFISNDGGTRGKPVIEYKLVKKGA
ncbi:HmuY family protein [Pedobacter aquatilis]|uniref:HmuY family protein n=1 Tax=Pedobacter aquatilis TaxID=351343 RepID=UPI0025B61EE3|nr:HmuY family protein [Pedobacter aquatilis]MDN3585343.1 HmuY family protein [Pedobacter aquatilis]